MSDRPTVLHYLGADDDYGGIVSVVRALAATGRFACVFGANHGFVQHRTDPLPVQALPTMRAETISLANFYRARTAARAVHMWLRNNEGAVFHGHTRAGLLVALWLHRFGERRVAVTVHCYGRQRWFYRWATRRLGTRMYWLTPTMKAYYGVGDGTWRQCIPNSVPGEPSPARRQLLQPGKLALGGAGMFVRWKRWERVLEALALLPPELRCNVSFTHIGAAEANVDSRHYAAELRATTQRLGLDANVTWKGWQPSSSALLAATDAVVVSSCREPFSMIALEALRAGVPVLGANEGGLRDVIAPGRNGWLYDGDSASALADRMRAMLDPGGLAKLDFDPRLLARFHSSVVSQQWAEVYASLLART